MRLNKFLLAAGVALTLAFNSGAADAARDKPKAKQKITRPAKPLAAAGATAVFVCVAAPEKDNGCLQLDDPQFSREVDREIPPASLVKLWTAYMVYKSGRDKLDEPFITLTEQDRIDGSMGKRNGVVAPLGGYSPRELKAGLTLSRREAILALTGFSANNVAVASAKALAPDGTEATFAQMMTDEVRHLGLQKTVFKTASGMPWDGQITTAREVASILNFIVADMGIRTFSDLYGNRDIRIAGMQLRKGGRFVGNAIDMIRNGGDNIAGGKTGHQNNTNNIALVSSIDGTVTYTVVLGSQSATSRDTLVTQILRRAGSIIPSAQAAQSTPTPAR